MPRMSAAKIWLAGLPSKPAFRMILAAPILCYIGWHTIAYLKKKYNVNNNGENGSNGALNGSSSTSLNRGSDGNGNGSGVWRGKPFYQVKRAREMEGPIYRVLGYDFWSPRTAFITPILIYMRSVVKDTL